MPTTWFIGIGTGFLGVGSRVLAGLIAFAPHEGLHERIARVSKRIAEEGHPVADHLERAELYRQHGDLPAALTDLAWVEARQPDAVDSSLIRARIAIDARVWNVAERLLDRYLGVGSSHTEAWTLRARCKMHTARPGEAVADFDRAIASALVPVPEQFLERARAMRQADAKDRIRVIDRLDQGMARLGVVPALQSFAIEVLVEDRQFDLALERLDTLRPRSGRQEHWLVRRGELLESAGRTGAAARSFEEAVSTIDRLSERHRSTSAVRGLRRRALERSLVLKSPSAAAEVQAESGLK